MAAINRHHLQVLLVLTGIFSAGGHEKRLGGYAGVLDRMGAGVAELGTGNTGTVRRDAMPAAYWNPALLAFQRGTSIAAGADVRSLNRNGGLAGVQGRIAPNMGLGLGIVNRGDFNIPVYDRNENFLGTARPQDIGFYLGLGLKSSRKNSYGAALQWFYSNKDIGGSGDINVIGIFNLGWYRSWNSRLKTGVVLRNLGFNSSLAAEFDVTTGVAQSEVEMDRSGTDFFPKTLVAGAMYTVELMQRTLDLYAEVLDFHLEKNTFDFNSEHPALFDFDHHAMDLRFGADWHYSSNFNVRTGYDRGNISCGFGYKIKTRKGKYLHFDYALMFEQLGATCNPYAVGLRYEL